jgi:hypothetical protein
MLEFGNALISFINGFILLLNKLFSPVFILSFVMFISLLWIMLIELDELDRQSSKPEIGRH